MDDKHENEEIEAGSSVPRQWKRWFKEDKEHSAEWRKDAREDYDFVAGRQWSEEDKTKLRDEMRPAITFNRTGVMLDAISGQEIQGKQAVHYYPREMGDAIANELYSEAARWFDDQSDADDEDSDAFVDTITCGMGWTETRMDFDEDPDGVPVTERVDPLEMFWDAGARKTNLKDSKRRWRVRELTAEEAKQEFPGETLNDLDAGKWVDTEKEEGGPNHNNPESSYENEQEGDIESRKTVRIVQLQYWRYVPYHKVADPMTGQVTELSDEEFRNLEKNLSPLGVQLKSVKLRKREYMQAFIGNKVLKHGPSGCEGHFTINCITGKRDRNKGTWYGLVRAMKDPQTWANKWLSQILHIMNSNAKGGMFYEEGAFVDQRDAERNYAKPNAMIGVRSGALAQGKIQERSPATFPAGYQMLTEYAVSAIRDVTGINLEILGMREANQPGVLEYQRKQAGMTVLATLFSSMRRYRRERGAVLLYYMKEYLSDGRLVRIMGQDKAQYVPLMKQADIKYDIIIDDAPNSPNQKEVVWQNLSALLPGIKDIVPPQVLLELLEYSPLPRSVTEKIKEVVKAPNPEAQQQAQMQAQMAMLEMQKMQTEIADTQAETQETHANIRKMESEAIENRAEAALDTARAELEERKHIHDVAKTTIEMSKSLRE
jgi:hypothetical protein